MQMSTWCDFGKAFNALIRKSWNGLAKPFIYLCIYAFMHVCIYSLVYLFTYLCTIYFPVHLPLPLAWNQVSMPEGSGAILGL